MAKVLAPGTTPAGATLAAVEADAAIVGSGTAGALIAWKWAGAGLRVAMIGAGPRVDRNAAVNRYRASIAQTPDSPYDKPAWAPYPIAPSPTDGYDLAGAGLFPTTGTANPTATVATRSLRTAAVSAHEFGMTVATPVATPAGATPVGR